MRKKREARIPNVLAMLGMAVVLSGGEKHEEEARSADSECFSHARHGGCVIMRRKKHFFILLNILVFCGIVCYNEYFPVKG